MTGRAPTVPCRIFAGLGFLGIEFDEKRNVVSLGLIFSETSKVTVRGRGMDDREHGLPRFGSNN